MSSCRVLMPGFAGLRRQRRQFETSVAAGFLEAVVQKVETFLFPVLCALWQSKGMLGFDGSLLNSTACQPSCVIFEL